MNQAGGLTDVRDACSSRDGQVSQPVSLLDFVVFAIDRVNSSANSIARANTSTSSCKPA